MEFNPEKNRKREEVILEEIPSVYDTVVEFNKKTRDGNESFNSVSQVRTVERLIACLISAKYKVVPLETALMKFREFVRHPKTRKVLDSTNDPVWTLLFTRIYMVSDTNIGLGKSFMRAISEEGIYIPFNTFNKLGQEYPTFRKYYGNTYLHLTRKKTVVVESE